MRFILLLSVCALLGCGGARPSSTTARSGLDSGPAAPPARPGLVSDPATRAKKDEAPPPPKYEGLNSDAFLESLRSQDAGQRREAAARAAREIREGVLPEHRVRLLEARVDDEQVRRRAASDTRAVGKKHLQPRSARDLMAEGIDFPVRDAPKEPIVLALAKSIGDPDLQVRTDAA